CRKRHSLDARGPERGERFGPRYMSCHRIISAIADAATPGAKPKNSALTQHACATMHARWPCRVDMAGSNCSCRQIAQLPRCHTFDCYEGNNHSVSSGETMPQIHRF